MLVVKQREGDADGCSVVFVQNERARVSARLTNAGEQRGGRLDLLHLYTT